MGKNTNVNKIEQLKKVVDATARKLDLSKEDKLMIENLQLKVMNISLQEQSLIQHLGQLRSERDSVQQQLLAHRDEMSKKYGIDFTKFDVHPCDGRIVPKGSTPPSFIR